MALVTAQRASGGGAPALVTGDDAIHRDGFSHWNVFQRLDGQRPGSGYDSHGTSHTRNLKLSGCVFPGCPDELEPRQHSLVVLEPTVLSLDSFGRCYAHGYRTGHNTAKTSPALVAGVCVVLLPLCGANGLGLVPALALWLGYAAILQWRVAARAGRRAAIIVAALAAAALLLVGLYFVGYNAMPHFSLTHSRRAILTAAAQFLTMGFGPGVVGLSFDHRTPMFFWPFVCAVVVGLFWLLVGCC